MNGHTSDVGGIVPILYTGAAELSNAISAAWRGGVPPYATDFDSAVWMAWLAAGGAVRISRFPVRAYI